MPAVRSASKGIGVTLFCLGVVGIVIVFVLAAVAFANVPAQIADAKRVAEQGLGSILSGAVVKAVFLLVMTYAASLIASKGMDLYHTAGRKDDR